MVRHPPSPTRFLWWIALWTLIFGGAFAYIIYMQDSTDPGRFVTIRQIVLGSIVIAGFCVIGATSRLWLKR